MTRDYLEIGSSPCEESCVQVESGKDYMPAMKEELKRYKALLQERFPDPPEGAWFSIKYSPHDFGSYGEVVVVFDDNDREAADFAYFVESHSPSTWDDKEVYTKEGRKQ